MTWTPATAPRTRRDHIRAAIKDVDVSDPIIQDEDLDYYLGKEPTSDERALWRVCVFLMGNFAREATEQQVGPLREKAQERYENFRDLALFYWNIANGGSGDGNSPGPATKARRTADAEPFFTRSYPR